MFNNMLHLAFLPWWGVTDEETAKFFCEFLDQRRKFFAAKRAEAKRNKPPTQAQQRKLYSTYLKKMERYTLKQLKGSKFESSKKGENEKVSSLKRTGKELESDKSKKHKLDENVEAEVDDAKEAEELKQCLEIVPDDGDDVTVDAIPFSVKMPIVNYKIYQEGKKIKARFKKTEPVNYMDTFLLLNLKTMFEHHLEDNGRIVGIKSLLEVTAVKLVLVVQKLLLLVLKVNAAGLKVTTDERLQLLKE
ncbi:hypothetical protein Tco_1069946 [Tanacetum coccineum]|uniref:Uncharacterized protein n=1 Tax=Tanacetum coccineum TaxID=301880 RepID=A0ABQ5HLD7_9ASTR